MSEASLGERFRALVSSRPIQEIGAEMKRLGVQGGMEASNLLFNGQAFTLYGPGQWKDGEREGMQQQQQQQQKRGMSM